jgi:hypothetical protein
MIPALVLVAIVIVMSPPPGASKDEKAKGRRKKGVCAACVRAKCERPLLHACAHVCERSRVCDCPSQYHIYFYSCYCFLFLQQLQSHVNLFPPHILSTRLSLWVFARFVLYRCRSTCRCGPGPSQASLVQSKCR